VSGDGPIPRGKAVIEWPGWGRKRSKQQGMSRIAELVPKALPKKQPEEARLAKMIALWERSVPRRVALNVTPVRVRGQTLYLHTTASVWAQEVSLLAPQLIAHMRSREPTLSIHSLAPRMGPMPLRVPVEIEEKHIVKPLRPDELPEEVRASLSTVPDEALREMMTKAACAMLAGSRKP
jgi:hypothetical protein